MKNKILVLTLAFIFATGFSVIFTAKTTFAQCACTCVMVCGNSCEAGCDGCGMIDAVNKATACCIGASNATGDTGPCPASPSMV